MDDPVDLDVDDDRALRRFHGPRSGDDAKSVRVLLFGDSLTAFPLDGYLSYGTTVAKQWPNVVLDICGFCGMEAAELVESMDEELEDACGQSGPGLRKLLRRAEQQGHRYDLAVLMAGTNDLQEMRCPATPIGTCIQYLHMACHVEGVKTVALSVPPNRFLENTRYHQRWTRVNEMLQSWCEAEGYQEGVTKYVDVQQILPYKKSSSEMWNEDGLHFSPLGAETLGRHLVELLQISAASSMVPRCHQALAVPMPIHLQLQAPGPGDVETVVPRPVKWLFYGDSLTAGFHAFGRLFTPYAMSLGRHLQLHAPNELWVCGLSGLEAVELLERKNFSRIRDAVRRTGPGIERLLSEMQFDLAFIMLGTNDLANHQEEEIFSAIKQIHEECHRVQLPTLALAVPPSQAATRLPEIGDSRRKVNELLKLWAKETPLTHFVDTGVLLPWTKDNEHWDLDGLHFSRRGSQVLGQRLAQYLQTEAGENGANGRSRPTWMPKMRTKNATKHNKNWVG